MITIELHRCVSSGSSYFQAEVDVRPARDRIRVFGSKGGVMYGVGDGVISIEAVILLNAVYHCCKYR